jgi:hypothetical protein
VSSSVKFPVTRQTAKASYTEIQTHGYEVDVVAARADELVLATVKSFFGSQGVKADHVTGTTSNIRWRKSYALLNDPGIREGVIAGACERYGYDPGQVELCWRPLACSSSICPSPPSPASRTRSLPAPHGRSARRA